MDVGSDHLYLLVLCLLSLPLEDLLLQLVLLLSFEGLYLLSLVGSYSESRSVVLGLLEDLRDELFAASNHLLLALISRSKG